MKSRIDRLAEGYEKVKTPSGGVVVEYTGWYYRYRRGKLSARGFKAIHTAVAAAGIACLVFGMSRRSALNTLPYVGGIALPSFAAEIFVAVGAGFLLASPEWMTVQRYRDMRWPLFYGGLAASVVLAATLLGAVYAVRAGGLALGGADRASLAGYALALLANGALAVLHRPGRYEPMSNKIARRRLGG